jgi:hypothetical protein
MSYEGTIYLDFDCASHDYQVDSAESADLVHYILDLDPDLEASLFSAVDRLYPKERWSSPGNSMLRRLCGWIFQEDEFPELRGAPDSLSILERIQRVRDCMTMALSSRDFERHYYRDFPAATRRWRDQKYQVISFSTVHSQQERQNRILELAVPDCHVVPVALPGDDSDAFLDYLLGHFPQDPSRCFLILAADRYILATAWRRKRIKSILVDRHWVPEPYLMRGYGYYIRALTDFNPDQELTRDYY